ncbi:MAG: 4-aminobutyrate--2-oxoglutarate transaminase [Thermaerobacter sp.]|nr:4-aminobutyrate--2-oxoglutarate transaminase [Thermaerobacter sp.]
MQAIQLLTEIPGPRSRDLYARRQSAVPVGVSQTTPIFAARTEGARIVDVDGNTFLDFAGGIGVLNVGANRPEVVEAVRSQAGLALHTCFHVTMNEPYLEVAEALNRITPGDFPKKTLLVSTGAEGVENAIKIARRYTGRQAVIGFSHAFHGRTLLGMSLTAKVATYKYGFGPFAPEVYRLPSCGLYHSPFASEEETVRYALEGVRRAIEDEIGKDKVAAIIIEPVQGEGGFIVQPPQFLRGLSDLARQYGIVLVIDEIQTGFGRCGRLFASELSGVVPDLILTAKSLAGGLPLAAVTGRAEIMDAAQVGGLGGTYGGNPVACAAALAIIRLMEEGDLLERARLVGARVLERFQRLREGYDLAGDVRGLGAMIAIEFVSDRDTKEPATQATDAIHRRAYERGLVLMKAGDHNNIIRFLAPLVIADEELEEGLDILERTIAEVATELVEA